MKYDFKHAVVCPNKEENHESWLVERKRAIHAEGLLWAALQPVTCPECKAQNAHFYDNPSVADPCRVFVWGCKGCGAMYSDFPTPEKMS